MFACAGQASLAILFSLCLAQQQKQQQQQSQPGNPDEVVRNIHEVNADGSYTFGFQTAAGEFKIETKDAEGNVRGECGGGGGGGKELPNQYWYHEGHSLTLGGDTSGS